ncbi:MAG: hypothetical protein IPK13_02725 [Deltaproteobacteria bacterium]|nr:hypothetical protein [Deltaproteobacteria bacterium]
MSGPRIPLQPGSPQFSASVRPPASPGVGSAPEAPAGGEQASADEPPDAELNAELNPELNPQLNPTTKGPDRRKQEALQRSAETRRLQTHFQRTSQGAPKATGEEPATRFEPQKPRAPATGGTYIPPPSYGPKTGHLDFPFFAESALRGGLEKYAVLVAEGHADQNRFGGSGLTKGVSVFDPEDMPPSAKLKTQILVLAGCATGKPGDNTLVQAFLKQNPGGVVIATTDKVSTDGVGPAARRIMANMERGMTVGQAVGKENTHRPDAFAQAAGLCSGNCWVVYGNQDMTLEKAWDRAALGDNGPSDGG